MASDETNIVAFTPAAKERLRQILDSPGRQWPADMDAMSMVAEALTKAQQTIQDARARVANEIRLTSVETVNLLAEVVVCLCATNDRDAEIAKPIVGDGARKTIEVVDIIKGRVCLSQLRSE